MQKRRIERLQKMTNNLCAKYPIGSTLYKKYMTNNIEKYCDRIGSTLTSDEYDEWNKFLSDWQQESESFNSIANKQNYPSSALNKKLEKFLSNSDNKTDKLSLVLLIFIIYAIMSIFES